MSLPSAYQKVEYIQSSGTQRINSGVTINPDYTVEANFIKTQNVTFGTLFGTRENALKRFNFRSQTDGSKFVCQRCYNDSTAYGEEYTFTTGYSGSDKHTIKMGRYVYWDGVLVHTFSATSTSWTSARPLGIFGLYSEGNNVYDYGYYKLFYLKIWDSSNNLVRDFLPCYRKSDNVAGLYDLINNTFYTNSGTGTFTVGPNISSPEHEMVNAYIGQGLIDFSYSYDFTNKSISTLQNDGYTLSNTGVQFGSNGVRTNNSTSWVDINTAEASFGVELTADSVYHAVLNGYWDGYSVPQVNFGGGCRFFFGMGGNTNTWRFHINGTNYTNTGSSTVAARKIDATVDLKNGTAEIKFYVGSTLTSTISRTLTTAEIESAIGNTPNAYVTPKRCWVKDISYNITNCKAL